MLITVLWGLVFGVTIQSLEQVEGAPGIWKTPETSSFKAAGFAQHSDRALSYVQMLERHTTLKRLRRETIGLETCEFYAATDGDDTVSGAFFSHAKDGVNYLSFISCLNIQSIEKTYQTTLDSFVQGYKRAFLPSTSTQPQFTTPQIVQVTQPLSAVPNPLPPAEANPLLPTASGLPQSGATLTPQTQAQLQAQDVPPQGTAPTSDPTLVVLQTIPPQSGAILTTQASVQPDLSPSPSKPSDALPGDIERQLGDPATKEFIVETRIKGSLQKQFFERLGNHENIGNFTKLRWKILVDISAISDFVECLEKMSNLVEVDFSKATIADTQGVDIVGALKDLRSLRTVNLSKTGIKGETVKKLVETLSPQQPPLPLLFPALKELDISGNTNIGDTTSIAKACADRTPPVTLVT